MSHVSDSAALDKPREQALLDSRPRIAHWRSELAQGREALKQAFFANPDTGRLLREHARLLDRVLRLAVG